MDIRATTSSESLRETSERVFLPATGEMADLVRLKDWSRTPLGAMETWSETLLATVNILLLSPSPFSLYWGVEMTLLYNDAYRPFLGNKHPAALGGRAHEVWEEAWHVLRPSVETAFGGEAASATEAYIPVLIDGVMQDRWWTYGFYPVYESGRIVGVANPGNEDTDKILARRSLLASEAQATRVLDSIGDAVIVTDAESRIQRMNPIAEQLTQWTEAEARERPLAEVFRIVDETTREAMEDPAERVKRGDGTVTLPVPTLLIGRHGTEFAIDDSGSPIRNESGEVSGIVLVFRDVEESRAAERARERLVLQLEQVMAATTEGIIYANRAWEIVYFNAAGKRIARVDEGVIGRTIWEVFPGMVYEGSPYLYHYHRAMDEGIEGRFENEYEELGIIVHVTVYPTADGVIMIFRDMTEERRSAAALMQTEKLAAVGRLASSIAHEINNPLESVTNLLYLMRGTEKFEEIREYIDVAERELRRVSIITNQTLRFHRQSTHAMPVFCYDLIGDSLSIYQGRLVNSGIAVEKRKRAEHPIRCFDGEIRQVLSNLIGNAIDAMPTGGRLLVRSREATHGRTGERGIVLTVADTGTGMPVSVQKKVFLPFFSTKGIGGTGLGLWVSSEIVARHRGTLRLRSREGVGCSGTVFTLFLPFEAATRG